MSITNVRGDINVTPRLITDRGVNASINPFWNVENIEVTTVPSNRPEVQDHLEAVVTDFSVTPGVLQSYDRSVIATQEMPNELGGIPQRTVYLRHAESGQWFTFELNVCTTDLPDGSEWNDIMGEFVQE